MAIATPVVNVEKPKTQSYKDAMNSAHLPSFSQPTDLNLKGKSVSNFEKAMGNQQAVLNNQNKKNNTININNNSNKPDESKNHQGTDKKDNQSVSNESHLSKRETTNENSGSEKSGRQKNPKSEKAEGNENQEKEKIKKPEENGNQGENTKKGNQVVKNNSVWSGKNLKQVIEQSQLQKAEMIRIKESIKEKHSESTKINTLQQTGKILIKDPNSDASEEKGITNQLLNKAHGQLEKTKEIKSDPVKLKNEPESEKSQGQENNNSKNSDQSILNNELKIKTNENLQEKQPHINLLNDLSKALEQVNNIKVQKTANTFNPLLEQYQIFREKITSSLENNIKLMVSSGESRATIQLHPPELGRLQVDLIVHKNKVTAKINTENTTVKEVILANLDQLKSNLANAGTQINKFDVEVGGFKNQFEQHFSKGESGGRGNERRGNEYSSNSDNENLNPGEVRNYAALTAFLGRSINCVI